MIEAAEKGPGKLIINRLKTDLVRKGEMLSSDDVFDILGLSIIGIIPEDEMVLSASNSGIPVTLNLNSQAGLAFGNIARRIMGEDVPFMDLDGNPGILRRFLRLFDGR